MKKNYLFAITTVLLSVLVACNKGGDDGGNGNGEKTPPPVPVRVTGVTLDRQEKTLYVDKEDTFLLTATVAPADAANQNISWESSRPDVASVDGNGNVKALSKGRTVIVVTTEEGEFTDECTVTVNATSPTDIAISKSTLTLVKGQTATLTATVSPDNADDKTCSWSSSNDAVATVENGVVTALGTGNATITVKTADGSLEDECAVTVQEGVLLNTVIWAERNVGAPGQFASSPEDIGMLYKWGSKVGWSSADPLQSSAGATTWDTSSTDGSTPWPAADDPCPDGWRIPTLDEIVWLTFYDPSGQGKTDNGEVKWEPAEVNGVLGIRFSDMDIAGVSIFLPVDGYRIGTNGALSGKSNVAEMSGMTMYWASDVVASSGAETEGHRLYLSRARNTDGSPRMTVEPMAITKRSFAFGIRCVKKSN